MAEDSETDNRPSHSCCV